MIDERPSRTTEPFLLAPRTQPSEVEDTALAAAPEPESLAPAEPLTLDGAGRGAVRRVSLAIFLEAFVLASLAVASFTRVFRDGVEAMGPELLVGALALALAIPALHSARDFWRVGRRSSDAKSDARYVVQAVGHLRALFIVKATLLFVTLGLGCFAFSLIAALVAAL